MLCNVYKDIPTPKLKHNQIFHPTLFSSTSTKSNGYQELNPKELWSQKHETSVLKSCSGEE